MKEKWKKLKRKLDYLWVRVDTRVDGMWREYIRDPLWHVTYAIKRMYWDIKKRAMQFWVDTGLFEYVEKPKPEDEDEYFEDDEGVM